MTTKAWRKLIFLPWLSVPLVLMIYVVLWSSIPERLVTQFNLAGRPSGWMSRERLLVINTGVLLFVLISFTSKLLSKARHGTYAEGIVVYYFTVGLLMIIFLGLLLYNL